MRQRPYGHLTPEDRAVLAHYLRDGMSLREIARKLGRAVSALSYEITINSRDGSRTGYDPAAAELQARFRKWDANRRNPLKNPAVMQYVMEKLHEDWSPQQIAGRMMKEYPHHKTMRISHETIYQFINAEAGHRLGLVRHLRRGKWRRHKKQRRGKWDPQKQAIPARISIDERPAIVARKGRYGDWESDSMVGTLQRGAALSVQKERKCQYLRLRKVHDKSARETTAAIDANLRVFPQEILRTLTFDNGRENVGHVSLQQTLGIATYFCDPYASWQKGSVENSIGLIRQYIPKGTRLDGLSDSFIHETEEKLNTRPRKCLGYRTPKEVLSRYLKKLGVQLPT